MKKETGKAEVVETDEDFFDMMKKLEREAYEEIRATDMLEYLDKEQEKNKN